MGIRVLRSAVTAGALALALCVTAAVPAGSATAVSPRADYPSWEEVQNARGNETATAATIAQIDQLLTGLQAEAARLGDEAVARGAESALAHQELARAVQAADSLKDSADAAARQATKSASQAAQIVAALYRAGGADLTTSLLLGGEDSDLLDRLGTLDSLGSRLERAMQDAELDRNQATSLSDQAEVARTERDKRAKQAQVALDAAKVAEDTANAAVASQQAHLSQLYDQLATLKNTTALIEQQYRVGQQAAEEPNGNPGSGGGTGGGFVVPGSEVNNVAAARAFAFGQLAAMGYGGEQADCLLWLWNRESGWRTNAYNASSGAYGIPQALPGSKMANWAADWRTNYETQVMWGLAYIGGRYPSPCGAWAHSQANGWY